MLLDQCLHLAKGSIQDGILINDWESHLSIKIYSLNFFKKRSGEHFYMGGTESSYWFRGTNLAASSRRRPVMTSKTQESQAMSIDQPNDVCTCAICSCPMRFSVSSRAFWEYLMYRLTPERVRRPENTHAQARVNAPTQPKPITANHFHYVLF